jgi:hypothetical protein
MRKVDFKEAFSYNIDSFRILQYYTMQLRIFNLEYLQGRCSIPASQVIAMESRVLAGCPFWTEVYLAEKVLDIEYEIPQDEKYESDEDPDENKNVKEMPVSERVIRLVLKKKKSWANLAFDMS